MPIDIAQVTRDVQRRYLGSPPERMPTLAELNVLLESLREVTERIQEHGETLQQQIAQTQWWRDFLAWEERLQMYQAHVNRAENRDDVTWTVTGPLVMGSRRGDGGNVEYTYPDAVTPFILLNGLEVAESSRREAFDMFVKDIQENAKKVGSGIKSAAFLVGIAAAAYLVGRDR